MPALRAIELTERFKRDFKRLDAETQQKVRDIIEHELLPWPARRALRHHTLKGYKPPIHVIDVSANHAHQVTFTCDGDLARLLRVGTHKQIDREPAG